jgi:hypothetical protein
VISPKVWRTLTDLNEDEAIARYLDRAAGQHMGRRPVSRSVSTRRQEEAASESGLARFPASSYRSRRDWACVAVWVLAFAVSAVLWALLIAVIRFIAQQA